MPAWPDWFWWTIGGVLGASGLALLIWSLFADRARGRRRCPRCWYDMSGTPGLTCSECGYPARRERRLFKTHRRWRWAMVSFLLLLASAASTMMPAIRRGAWPELLPTTALIYLSPPSAQPGTGGQTSVSGVLFWRFEHNKMWDWQIRWWITRSLAGKPAPWRIMTRTRQNWPDGSDVYVVAGFCRNKTLRWFDSLVFRVRVDPMGTDDETLMLVSEEAGSEFSRRALGTLSVDRLDWYHQFGRLRPASVAGGRVRLRTILECGDSLGRSYYNVRQWHVIEQNVIEMDVNVHGSVADLMEPVSDPRIDEQIRRNVWVAAWEDGFQVVRAFPKIPELGDDAALGLVFEIVHNQEVVAKGSGWWGNNNARRVSERLPWEVGTLDLELMRRHPDDQWLLRVRGDPELALRAFDDRAEGAPEQKRYWSGQVEIPLKYSGDDAFAIPRENVVLWPDRPGALDITLRSRSCQ